MGIPENLKRLRGREKLSQAELGKKSGTSQQLISQLERGENLTTKYLPQIARALNASIYEIDEDYAVDGVGLEEAKAIVRGLTVEERTELLAFALSLPSSGAPSSPPDSDQPQKAGLKR